MGGGELKVRPELLKPLRKKNCQIRGEKRPGRSEGDYSRSVPPGNTNYSSQGGQLGGGPWDGDRDKESIQETVKGKKNLRKGEKQNSFRRGGGDGVKPQETAAESVKKSRAREKYPQGRKTTGKKVWKARTGLQERGKRSAGRGD